jgi:hypothetical protein
VPSGLTYEPNQPVAEQGPYRSGKPSEPAAALHLSLTSPHPAKRGRYDWSAEEPKLVAVLPGCFALQAIEHARKMGVDKHQKRMGEGS